MASARLIGDPNRYIRRVRGGKFHARPYDMLDGERANLGLFPTEHAARVAIQEFWAGKRKDLPKFTRRRVVDGVEQFFAKVCFGAERYCLGPFATRDQAAAAAAGICQAIAGPLFGYAMTKRLGCGGGSYVRVRHDRRRPSRQNADERKLLSSGQQQSA